MIIKAKVFPKPRKPEGDGHNGVGFWVYLVTVVVVVNCRGALCGLHFCLKDMIIMIK